MIKGLALLFLSLCFCPPSWAGRNVASADHNAIRQEIRNAIRDVQRQLPELLKAVRIKVQIPEIQVRIPEIKVQIPDIQLPEIQLQIPVNIQIPEIQLPEIRVEIPRIDFETGDLPK